MADMARANGFGDHHAWHAQIERKRLIHFAVLSRRHVEILSTR